MMAVVRAAAIGDTDRANSSRMTVGSHHGVDTLGDEVRRLVLPSTDYGPAGATKLSFGPAITGCVERKLG